MRPSRLGTGCSALAAGCCSRRCLVPCMLVIRDHHRTVRCLNRNMKGIPATGRVSRPACGEFIPSFKDAYPPWRPVNSFVIFRINEYTYRTPQSMSLPKKQTPTPYNTPYSRTISSRDSCFQPKTVHPEPCMTRPTAEGESLDRCGVTGIIEKRRY